MRRLFCIAVGGLLGLAALNAAAESAVVLFQGRTVEVESALADPNDLWVPSGELERVNGFEVKPEGACFAEICVPIVQSEDSGIFVTREGQGWVSVTELARRLNQAFVHDADSNVWSFGEVPAVQSASLGSAIAPDFTLKNREGKDVRLSDFRGKKVLLMTWASW